MPRIALAACLALAGLIAAPSAPSASDGAGPLAGFERLVGGQWHLDSSHQEFEWGIGRTSVRARGYFLIEGKPKLVSEGHWFWHPGEKAIRGYVLATDMPVSLFDYTCRFDGDSLICDLRAYGPDGAPQDYVEKFAFVAPDRYDWSLWSRTPEGLRRAMGGAFERRAAGQAAGGGAGKGK